MSHLSQIYLTFFVLGGGSFILDEGSIVCRVMSYTETS